MPSTRKQDREPGVRRKGYTVFLALLVFATLGGMPAILHALHLKISTAPPASSDGIKLLGAPTAPEPVPLPPAALPSDPAGPTATFPPVTESLEAAVVAREDNRLRTMLHDSFRTFQPKIVPYRHSLPTLVLTTGRHTVFSGVFHYLVTGKSTYTAADLISNGAMVRLPRGGALLEDNVFVASGVHLDLSSSDVGAIYLDTTQRGSASIVAWGGNLDFRGTRQNPLIIKGWDEQSMTPAADIGNGRPYIREVAGTMTFEYARVSTLGFWSGRTGGVSWTGLSTHPSYGGAILSTFTGNTYGAFVTRGHAVRFSGDLFESNQLDGLHFHRGTVGSSAMFSAAVRNGANGFHVDRATSRTELQHDVSQHNATNGFLVDGRPLVISASASGNAVAPGQSTRIMNSAALDNGRTGILVEGGNRTVLKGDAVCAKLTGIALRYNASNAILDANDVRCGPRTGIRIGPQAPGALVFGNAVSGARIAVLVTTPGGSVEIDKSLITLANVFGISVRGVNSTVSGKDNVISGIGFRAVDSRAEATPPHLSGSNTANWAYARRGTVLTYLEFHPLAVFWLSVVFLVLIGCLWTRRRKAPAHPYPESTRWRGFDAEPEPVPVPFGASVGTPVGPVPVAAATTAASAGAETISSSALAGAQARSAPAGAQVSVGDPGHGGHLDRLDRMDQLDHLGQLNRVNHVDHLDRLGAADDRLGVGDGGEPLGPPWAQGQDARPDGVTLYRPPYEADAVPGYRGPFEAAMPDATRADGQRLDAGPLDPGSPDDGTLGPRVRPSARLDPGPLDVPRRGALGSNGEPRNGGPLGDGPLEGGPLGVGPLDGGPLDVRRPDRARRDNSPGDATRRDNGRRDSSRRDNGRRDTAPREGRRLDPQVAEAERLDPAPLEDARPYAGRADEHRQRSRHGRSDPIDSTKPLPQVGEQE